jgi:flagellar motor switch protein FliN/FliY
MADPSPTAGPTPDNALDNAAIDDLLKQAGTFAAAPNPAAADSSGGGPLPDQTSIEELLRQATFEDAGAGDAGGGPVERRGAGPPIDAEAYRLPNFNQVIRDAQVSSIDLLRDVELNVKIELGRARMLVEDVLRLSEGSVVELDKLAGDPVDVFVNDRLVARGEVLVLNDSFCVRVNEIVTATKEEGL